jgi:hypothetical protein
MGPEPIGGHLGQENCEVRRITAKDAKDAKVKPGERNR